MKVLSPTVRDRILLHLFEFREFAGSLDSPLDITQEGVAQAVWIDVRHVLQYARPLMEEGLVRERMAHIRGGRRRRKVYDLTEAGRQLALGLRKRVTNQVVQVRTPRGVEEQTIAQVMEETRGRLSLLDLIRRAVHAGAVDITALEAPAGPAKVEMLHDAPRVEEFYGREEVLELLSRDVDRPRLVVVRGVPGIGKSTLAAQVCARKRGTTNLFWHTVRSWDSPHSLFATLGTFLAALGKPGVREVIAEGQADMAPLVFRETLPSVEALLVFDDVHEASKEVLSSLRFLKDVLAEAPKVRGLFLTRRSIPVYDRRDVALDGAVQELDLEGFDPEEISTVLPAGAKEGTIQDLCRHPLFLKLFRRATGGRMPEEMLRDIHRFIEEVIYKELTEPERRVMKVASLYRVPVPGEALLCDPDLTHDHLLGLIDRALLTRVSDEGLEVHDTLRDFFASVLTRAERRELSAFATGRLNLLALDASGKGRFTEVVDYLSNAVGLNPPPSEWPSVHEALGDAMEQIGDLSGALSSYEKALGPGLTGERSARLQRKKAFLEVLRGEFASALEEVEAGFKALEGRVSAERGFLHLAASQVGFWTDEWEESREHAQSALEIFRSFPDLRGRAEALLFLAHSEAHLPTGNQDAARRYLEQASETADALGDIEFSMRVLGEMVYLNAFHLGQPGEGIKQLARLESLLRGRPDSLKTVKFLSLQGNIDLHLLANYDEAENAYRDILSLGEKFHSPFTLAMGRHGLADIAVNRGDYAAAVDGFMESALAYRGDPNLRGMVLESLCMAAWSALLSGNLAGFQRAVSAMRDEDLEAGFPSRPRLTQVIRGLEEFTKGNRARSLEILDGAIEGRAESRLVVDPSFPHLARSAIRRASGMDEGAEEDLMVARELLEASTMEAGLLNLQEWHERLTRSLKAFLEASPR